MTASRAERERNRPIEVAGTSVPAGRRRIIQIPAGRLVTGTELTISAAVINGSRPGPRLWLTGAIHGDELNGVEIVRRLIDDLPPSGVAGSVIAVPIVNVFGFIEGSRYLPDRRDLNRAFPGSRRGSLASRLAHLIVEHVVSHADVGLDFHTGSNDRTNLPQIRADLDDPKTRRLAGAFGAPLLLQSKVRDGSLRQAATELGKTVLVYEAGQAHRFDDAAIDVAVRGTKRVMAALGMIAAADPPPEPPIAVRSSSWIRARRAGILRLRTSLGAQVDAGDRLGEIGDALGGRATKVTAPRAGWVIGMTLNPLANRGDALVHLARDEEPA